MSPKKRRRAPRLVARIRPKKTLATAELFLSLRKSLKLTQLEFAERVGVSQPLVSKIEYADMQPPLDAFLRAYRILPQSEDADLVRAFNTYITTGTLPG